MLLQIPSPTIIAQAAGFLNRANYFSRMGLDPENMPEFREMAQMLWPLLEEELEQLRMVSHHSSNRTVHSIVFNMTCN